jgi:D-alanyl-lipoteichoic acid acyltransferase DltB (MBOAT superfamily)
LLAGACATAVLAAVRAPARMRVLPVLGVAIAVGVYGTGIVAVVLLHGIAYVAAGVLAAEGASTTEGPARRWRLAQFAMAGLGVAALAGRAVSAMAWRVPVAGYAWVPFYLDMMMFARLEALLWEVGSGRVKQVPPRAFITWCALPYGFFGPMLRFSEWLTQEESGLDGPSGEERRRALRTLGWGIAQIGGLLALVALATLLSTAPGLRVPFWRKALDWFAISPWTFYLGSAAYANFLIAAAAWTGIRLPTAYNWPFGRPNLSAFWANWNVPVTALVRDVLFYRRWGLGRNDAYVSVMVAFVVIGLWHAGNPYWVVWGLLHGIGYGVFLAYTRRLRAADRVAAIVGAVVPGPLVTYLFVCSCWAFTPQVLRLVRILWAR